LTSAPVALRVAEGIVVGVLVVGAVGVVVFDPDLGGELAPLELFGAADVVVEPWIAEVADREPSVRGADFV